MVLLLIVKLMVFMHKGRIIWAEHKLKNNIVIGVSIIEGKHEHFCEEGTCSLLH